MTKRLLIVALAAFLGLGALAAVPAAAAPRTARLPQAGAQAGAQATAQAGTPEQPAAQAPTPIPGVRPSADDGAVLYADNCAACHGAAGRGDGPDAAVIEAQTGQTLLDFTDAEYVREQSPAEWHEITTNGRMERFMPPFRDALSDEERLHVLYYVLTLSTPPDSVARGQELYASSCARCHGANGSGGGPDATGALPDLSNPASLFTRTTSELRALAGPQHPGLPDPAGDLSAEDGWALADAVRALGYAYSAPAALETLELDVTGVLTNGSAGGTVAAGLDVTLYACDSAALHGRSGSPVPSVVLTGTTSAGGFRFDDVAAPPDGLLMASVRYDGITYTGFERIDAAAAEINLPVTIYDATEDASAVRVSQMHVLFETPTGGGTLGVTEFFGLSTSGDRTFTGPLSVALPADAAGVSFPAENLGEFAAAPGGFSGRIAVRPGDTAEIIVTFELPAASGIKLDQTLTYGADTVTVLAPEGLEVSGAGLTPTELENTPEGYRVFRAGPFAPGAPLSLNSTAPAAALPWLPLVAGLGALLMVIGAVGWWYREQRRAAAEDDEEDDEEVDEDAGDTEEDETEGDGDVDGDVEEVEDDRESLLQAIADLDDAYADGRIDAGRYRRERDALKARLLGGASEAREPDGDD